MTRRRKTQTKRVRTNEKPIYARVADDLRKRLASGKYPVGSTLPTEEEFAESYGVSRHTIREAMRRLGEEGLISRRKRAGTQVRAATKPTIYQQPINTVNDLLQFAEGSEAKILKKSIAKCDRQLAALLEATVGQEWLCVETMRAYPTDPKPFCVTTNYLNRELLGVEEVPEDLSAPISALLEKRYGIQIARIEQCLEAVLLEPRDAKILKAKPKTAALRSTRRYYDEDDRLVELSLAIHPGDRFVYVMRLARETT